MKAFCLVLMATLVGGTASAQTPARTARGTYYIAPGTPSTIGRGGSVVGTVPGQVIPAPRGTMSTFGLAREAPKQRGPSAPEQAAPK